MSDTMQGPGWWQASDGKWYAPELNPDNQPPPPVPAALMDAEEGRPPPWKPIAISEKNVLQVVGDQVEIQWTLTTKPDQWWLEAFRQAPTCRSESIGFVIGSLHDPWVQGDGTILWSVPEPYLEGAAAVVKAAVEFANSKYPEVQAKLQVAREKVAAKETVRIDKLNELQRRLDATG